MGTIEKETLSFFLPPTHFSPLCLFRLTFTFYDGVKLCKIVDVTNQLAFCRGCDGLWVRDTMGLILNLQMLGHYLQKEEENLPQ